MDLVDSCILGDKCVLFITGVFSLLQVCAAVQFVQGYITGKQFRFLFVVFLIVSAGVVFLAVIILTYAGYIAPWSGRFYSLYDTG